MRCGYVLNKDKVIVALVDDDGVIRPLVDPYSIIERVLNFYPGVSLDVILSRRCREDIVDARFACMFAVHRERPDLSYPQLGKIFNRNHSSVMYLLGKLGKSQNNVRG